MSNKLNRRSNQEPDQTAAEGLGWHARLELRFEKTTEKTSLKHRLHKGPLRVQRPFYPETLTGPCHVYLLHPPGGLVGGDQLSIDVNAGPGAQVLITTPAANKYYRSAGDYATVQQRLTVSDGASLEWLPQDNIIFEGALGRQRTRVDLVGNAQFVGWEITALGRPAASEGFRHGTFDSKLEIWRDSKPLFIERTQFNDSNQMLSAAWGMRNASVAGTMIAVGAYSDSTSTIRNAWASKGVVDAYVTQLNGALVCRYLGHRADLARAAFEQVWSIVRPQALSREAHPPRIWAT